ncbi:MAG: hypothetical protein CML02_09805 [Pseudooceanicola sp.]|jgi:hypothetical protein|nr:hypothetical protein [Pseudooceanicola sp.]|tara:strand:- start:2300 stop:3694 length:1395 start_codon:yes stop_codon:yes gene_type:complete
MLCVTSRTRKRLAGAALALALAASPSARAQDDLALTLPQARALAVHALNTGDAPLALRLTGGLLQANSDDMTAHYLRAAAYARMNRPHEGRRSAARAYRHAKTREDKLRSSQLAAQLAYAEDRPSLAQIWLRRSAIHTATQREQDLLARDYRILRQRNPWSFSLRGEIRPSNNVNNGADSARNIIDGIPDFGFLPAAAQALSGKIGTVDAVAGYRLRQSETSQTTLSGRLYIQRVSLSSASQARVPQLTNSDFGSTYAEASLEHRFKAGDGAAGVQFSLGESWYGGDRNFRLARLGGDRFWRVGESSQLIVNGFAETRFASRTLTNDGTSFGMGATYRHQLGTGDTLSLSLQLRDTEATAPNGTFQTASLRAGYDFGRAFGPMRISTALQVGQTEYDAYRASLFIPATARSDTSVTGDVTLFFEDYDYAGFAPTVRISAGRRSSNFSMFSSSEFSVSLGIRSKF